MIANYNRVIQSNTLVVKYHLDLFICFCHISQRLFTFRQLWQGVYINFKILVRTAYAILSLEHRRHFFGICCTRYSSLLVKNKQVNIYSPSDHKKVGKKIRRHEDEVFLKWWAQMCIKFYRATMTICYLSVLSSAICIRLVGQIQLCLTKYRHTRDIPLAIGFIWYIKTS